jgi:cbb3-type cytochrome oxidase maturation protein
MSLLIVMLPMMIGFALVLLAGLMWAVRHGQFEDLEGEKHRILFDEPGYGE